MTEYEVLNRLRDSGENKWHHRDSDECQDSAGEFHCDNCDDSDAECHDDDCVLQALTAYQIMGELDFACDLNKALLQENPNESKFRQKWRANAIQCIRRYMQDYKNVRSKLKMVLGGYKCLHFEPGEEEEEEERPPTGVTDPFAHDFFVNYLDCGNFFEYYAEEVEECCFQHAEIWPAPDPPDYWSPLEIEDEDTLIDREDKEHLRDCFKPSPWAIQAVAHAYNSKHYKQIRAREARARQSPWAAELDRRQMKFNQEQSDEYRRSLREDVWEVDEMGRCVFVRRGDY